MLVDLDKQLSKGPYSIRKLFLMLDKDCERLRRETDYMFLVYFVSLLSSELQKMWLAVP